MSMGGLLKDTEGKIEVPVEKRVPVSLIARCIAHKVAWNWTRDSAVSSRKLPT